MQRQAPIPESRIQQVTPDLAAVQRRDTSDGSSSSGSSSSSGTETSTSSNTTPIVIGVVIPVLIIFIIMFVIWKRRQKITKHEEANDKYRSLDFGIDESGFSQRKGRKGKKSQPEMTVSDVQGSLRKDKGMSLDLGTTNPYLLPPEVHQSRESLHSLSRNINTGDDKYRATNFIPDDGSIRSPSSLRSHGDGSSVFTGSTRHRAGTLDTESKTDLLPRLPSARATPEPPAMMKPLPTLEKPSTGLLAPVAQDVDRNSTLSVNSNTAALRASHNYLGQFIKGGQKKEEPKNEEQPGLIVSEFEVQVTPPADTLRELPAAAFRDEPSTAKRSSSYYDPNQTGHAVAELPDNQRENYHPQQQPPIIPQVETTSYEMDATSQPHFPKRSQSIRQPQESNRPGHEYNSELPPVPRVSTQPEQADQEHHQEPQAESQDYYEDDASDYYDEEVYDDYQDYMGYSHRGSMMGLRPLPPDDPTENPEQRANRIRSFYKEYFDESGKAGFNRQSYFDGSEQYEQYDDFDYGYYEAAHSRGPSFRSDGRHRAFSHGAHGYYPPAGPRAFSSMSGRVGPRPRMPPKKKMPPPKPLLVLPTPHKLKDDDFLPNAIDFAPPQVFKNQRAGTPDSLRGGLRPYSPGVRPHVPLTSAFDDLAVVPSPHALRKSGTFTALDFAPPKRFKEPGDSMSDSGSIRSNRSNISRLHLNNIRNGAYRVSRIPKDVAGTRDDMYAALRPKWDMRGDGAATPSLR